MGKAAIKSYVETKLKDVEGIKRVYPGRLKDGEYPPTGLPGLIVEIGPERLVNQSYYAGGNGKMRIVYDINIVLILDRKDVLYAKAQTDALPFYDRIRATFSNDYKLGGLAWDATLTESINNLDVFREADVGQYPQVAWKLRVVEERAYNETAS